MFTVTFYDQIKGTSKEIKAGSRSLAQVKFDAMLIKHGLKPCEYLRLSETSPYVSITSPDKAIAISAQEGTAL